MSLTMEEKDEVLGFTPQDRLNMQRVVAMSGAERVWNNKYAVQLLGDNKYAITKAKRLYDVVTDNDLNVPKLHDLVDELYGKVLDEPPSESVISKLKNHYNFMKKFGQGGEKITNDEFKKLAEGKNGSTRIMALAGIRKLKGQLECYNSDRYAFEEDEAFYQFIKKGKNTSFLVTKRKPNRYTGEDEEKYKQAKLTFSDKNQDIVQLEVKNEFVGLRNRWFLIISTKMPKREDFEGQEIILDDGSTELKQSHCGMVVFYTDRGSNVYVYGKVVNANVVNDEKLKENGGSWNNSCVVIGSGYTQKRLDDALKYYVNQFMKKRTIVMQDGKTILNRLYNIKMYSVIKPKQQFEEKIKWLKELPMDNE